ncbi:MAG: hypothetical protein IPI46_08340 [Bacteroidetes bacterium]|nr:hypothetical protein [Bacteroidota bacterium]
MIMIFLFVSFYTELVNPLILLAILFSLIFTFKEFLKLPANFFDIVMVKSLEGVIINKTLFKYEDLIFLSFRENENYSVIRLEAKRKNILFANDLKLIAGLDSFDRALTLSRQLRNFISLDLKINHITMGFAAPRLWRGYFEMPATKASDIENWHFID